VQDNDENNTITAESLVQPEKTFRADFASRLPSSIDHSSIQGTVLTQKITYASTMHLLYLVILGPDRRDPTFITANPSPSSASDDLPKKIGKR